MNSKDEQHPTVVPRRPEQLTLFPDEEDSILYDSSEAYRQLTPVEKAIVRCCLVEIYVECKWPTQTKIAAAAGVSRTTVQKYLADRTSLVHTAISQISATHGGDLCKRCRDIVPQIALMICQQVKAGRPTSTLTQTEYNIVKLATEMGGFPLAMTNGAPPVNVNIAAQSSGDGARVGVQITSGETDALSAYLSKLSTSQRMQPAPVLSVETGQPATPLDAEASDAASGGSGGPGGVGQAEEKGPGEAVSETAPACPGMPETPSVQTAKTGGCG